MPDLRSQRPQVRYGDVVCAICNQPCDFTESGMHSAGYTLPHLQHLRKNDKQTLLSGQGLVLIHAHCHGAECNAAIDFHTLRQLDGRKIVLFGKQLMIGNEPYELPELYQKFYDPETGEPCDMMGNPVLPAPAEKSALERKPKKLTKRRKLLRFLRGIFS